MAKKAWRKLLKDLRVLILDIDGVLTDGRIFWVEGTGWTAAYSVIDGFGIRLLQKAGVEVCFISGGAFKSHQERAKILKIQHAYFGNEDKIHAYEKIKSDLQVTDEQCAFMADELFDLPVLKKVGVAVCPPDATREVKKIADFITKRKGGFGAAREFIDLILQAKQ